jgi:hypothetical protein
MKNNRLTKLKYAPALAMAAAVVIAVASSTQGFKWA